MSLNNEKEDHLDLHPVKKPLIQIVGVQTKKLQEEEVEEEEQENFPHQILSIGIFISCMVKTVSCWQMASILVTAIAPSEDEYWCKRPEEYIDTSAESWINQTHVWLPTVNRFDKCHIRKGDKIEKCVAWEFAKDDSIIEEWHLVCEYAIYPAVQQFFYLFGIFSHGLASLYVHWRFEIRKILFAGMIAQIICGGLVACATNFAFATVLRFLTALSCGFMFTSGCATLTRMYGNRGPKWQIVIPASYEVFWSLGTLTLGPISMAAVNWRLVQLCISLPTIFLLALSWNLPDLPHIPVTPDKNYEIPSKVKFVRIFAVHVALSSTIVNFYGGLLNSRNWSINHDLSHYDLYRDIFIAGLAEIIGMVLGIIFMLEFPRIKWLLLAIVDIIGAIPMILCYFLYDNHVPYLMIIGFFGRIATACSLAQLLVQMKEFFVGIKDAKIYIWSAICTSRFFLLWAPFINFLVIFHPRYPMMFLGSLNLIGGLAMFALVAVGQEKEEDEA